MWFYDCSQRNKQNLNVPSDKIKMLAGGFFVASVATIGYAIPPVHTSAHIYKSEKVDNMAENSKLRNLINRFKKVNPWMRIDLHSGPIRAIVGAAIGSLCLCGVEDLYLTLNLTGSRRDSAKY